MTRLNAGVINDLSELRSQYTDTCDEKLRFQIIQTATEILFPESMIIDVDKALERRMRDD